MNRRELLGCFAATLLGGCRQHQDAAPNDGRAGPASIDGVLATVRGECHPLDLPAAAKLLGPTRQRHEAISKWFDPPDVNFYMVSLLCDASRRLAEVESAAAAAHGGATEGWSSHRDQMSRLRDELQGMLDNGNVTTIEVSIAASEAAIAAARATRATDARRWALADARWLARDVQRGLWQRAQADEPLHPRFVESHCMASWRLLRTELELGEGTEAVAQHVKRLRWVGDDWIGGIMDASLGPQFSTVAYHLRLAEEAATTLGVPPGVPAAAPRHVEGLLESTAADACASLLEDWTRKFEADAPVTPVFAHECCVWSARLAAAERSDDPARGDDARRRHLARMAQFLTAVNALHETSEQGTAAQRAVVRHAIAEAEACLCPTNN